MVGQEKKLRGCAIDSAIPKHVETPALSILSSWISTSLHAESQLNFCKTLAFENRDSDMNNAAWFDQGWCYGVVC